MRPHLLYADRTLSIAQCVSRKTRRVIKRYIWTWTYTHKHKHHYHHCHHQNYLQTQIHSIYVNSCANKYVRRTLLNWVDSFIDERTIPVSGWTYTEYIRSVWVFGRIFIESCIFMFFLASHPPASYVPYIFRHIIVWWLGFGIVCDWFTICELCVEDNTPALIAQRAVGIRCLITYTIFSYHGSFTI